MAKLLCYSKETFERVADDNWWAYSYVPDDVAIISICEPYSESNDLWEHKFEHDGVRVYNMNIPDIDSLKLSALLKDSNGDKRIYEVPFHEEVWVYEENGKKYYPLNPDEAFGLANFIVNNQGKDFYIHCSMGMSRSQGVVKAILKNFPEFYNQASLNQNNLPEDEYVNKWVEDMVDKQIKRIKR